MNWKRNLLRAALSGTLLLGAALLPSGTALARDCSDRIRSEEIKLRRDIERHGFFSRQAAHRREKLNELRESCARENRRFFSGRDRDRNGRWHDRDNDRDRDNRWRRDRDDWRHRDRDHDRD
jgi:hypothetical protein